MKTTAARQGRQFPARWLHAPLALCAVGFMRSGFMRFFGRTSQDITFASCVTSAVQAGLLDVAMCAA